MSKLSDTKEDELIDSIIEKPDKVRGDKTPVWVDIVCAISCLIIILIAALVGVCVVI